MYYSYPLIPPPPTPSSAPQMDVFCYVSPENFRLHAFHFSRSVHFPYKSRWPV